MIYRLNIQQEPEFIYIDSIYNDYIQNMNIFNTDVLIKNTDLLSFTNEYTEIYRKIFVIACANAFEKHFCSKFSTIVSRNEILNHFITKQSIQRKYHMLFDWEGNNANSFYGLFGEEFKNLIIQELSESKLKTNEKDFLLIGRYRNHTVHKGFNESTFSEDIHAIKEKFRNALKYYEFLLNFIQSHSYCDDYIDKKNHLISKSNKEYINYNIQHTRINNLFSYYRQSTDNMVHFS